MTLSAIEGVAASAMPANARPLVGPSGGDFGAMLLGGVSRVDTSLQQAKQAVAQFAVGGETPPHQVMLALEEARMSLEMALQIRSRLVEGYQEMMRMTL